MYTVGMTASSLVAVAMTVLEECLHLFTGIRLIKNPVHTDEAGNETASRVVINGANRKLTCFAVGLQRCDIKSSGWPTYWVMQCLRYQTFDYSAVVDNIYFHCFRWLCILQSL